MIRFWAFVYRHTGWMSPWAKAAHWKFISIRLTPEQKISVGLWEHDRGFTRKWDPNEEKDRLKRFKS